ncbi:hypothetical protein TYRP_002928 [Tyrophagus putrescentiae]|nr:hypothetical protein TYRP_002928 [Tyrophagus putrescentiae]
MVIGSSGSPSWARRLATVHLLGGGHAVQLLLQRHLAQRLQLLGAAGQGAGQGGERLALTGKELSTGRQPGPVRLQAEPVSGQGRLSAFQLGSFRLQLRLLLADLRLVLLQRPLPLGVERLEEGAALLKAPHIGPQRLPLVTPLGRLGALSRPPLADLLREAASQRLKLRPFGVELRPVRLEGLSLLLSRSTAKEVDDCWSVSSGGRSLQRLLPQQEVLLAGDHGLLQRLDGVRRRLPLRQQLRHGATVRAEQLGGGGRRPLALPLRPQPPLQPRQRLLVGLGGGGHRRGVGGPQAAHVRRPVRLQRGQALLVAEAELLRLRLRVLQCGAQFEDAPVALLLDPE